MANRYKDIAGQRFGNLTALYPVEKTDPTKQRSKIWHCKCDCGNECDVAYKSLHRGIKKSCGCMRKVMKYEDITGQKFGKLTALYPLEETEPKRPPSLRKWHCKCDCGNECDVSHCNLISGHTKSCGCLRSDYLRSGIGRKYTDIAGQRFGKLTALYPVESTERTNSKLWHCRCDCENECDVPSYALTSGRKKSCGCLKRGRGYTNIAGQKFGNLTVLYPVKRTKPVKHLSKMWHCRCDCGNECDVSHCNLISGHTKSCGCLREIRRYKDLTGQKFGKLTALYVVESTNRRIKSKMWHCRCDCGNECNVLSKSLISGGTKSCGCLRKRK